MADLAPGWEDPGLEPAAAVDVKAICPECGDPVLNPTPVLVRAPHVNEAWCICANNHLWITKWTTDTDSEAA